MYGGWWFFAFPVKEVTRYPFPFFVRGDDINFSLANDFHISTLNGVVSFAEDFSDKESPMTLYLDLRNHFVQHLTLDKMEIGPLNIAKIGIGFFLRNIAKFQYETVDALLMAWNDVLKGPEFFAENADAVAQRAAIKALYKVELWKPVSEIDMTERRRYWAGDIGAKCTFFRLTLNGHLLPFYNLWGNRSCCNRATATISTRSGASSRITYLNSTRGKGLYRPPVQNPLLLRRSFRLTVADRAAVFRLWRAQGQVSQGLCRNHRAQFLAKGAKADQTRNARRQTKARLSTQYRRPDGQITCYCISVTPKPAPPRSRRCCATGCGCRLTSRWPIPTS